METSDCETITITDDGDQQPQRYIFLSMFFILRSNRIQKKIFHSGKKKYHQNARSKWLNDAEFKGWLSIVNSTEVKCKYCNCTMAPKKSGLQSHMATVKHRRAIADYSNQPRLKNAAVKVSSTKSAEARLALFVAVHTSINVADHLTKTVKSCHGGNASDVMMSRTKCAALIRNVWHPHFQRSLAQDVIGCYSLIVDESTDVGTTKFLGVVVKYLSRSKDKIVSTFLKLQEIDHGDADSIVAAIRTVLIEFGLDIQRMVGLGTDNANVMVGHIGGVYTKLKVEVKHLILIPCVYHSLQLAISETCKDFLPPSLEFLISETYNWFGRRCAKKNTR